MLRGLFVTGTGTGVGKTVVAAALFHRFHPSSPLRYWKPLQTGIEQDDDTATVRRLAGCGAGGVLDRGVRLPRPVSPHLAARLANQPIDMSSLIGPVMGESPASWIIEGAGGVLVPLNDRDTMASLMRELALPVLIVARSDLGTINHTLLTIEAVRARGLRVAGVVMVGVPDADNREAIARHGAVTVLGELPPLDPLAAEALASWASRALDPDGALEACFR